MQADSKFKYREEAIPLITLNTETNKFVINDEAVALIHSIKGNIGVISVAGLYRTGKSYLLNRMILDRATGFGVGPSINPCTKGLWVWGTPITGQTANGEPLQILIIDSEGIGALDQDSAHDNRIFSLTVLLSSCFIYNSTGSIDENAIQNLSMIVNITKNIQIKSQVANINERDPEEYSKYFPSFTWVLRDFALQLVDTDGAPLTSREYLERSLALQKGTSDGIEQKNKIRKLLRTYFKERDCFTLVRPLTNEENLQNLDKIGLDQLRPEFSRQVISLRRAIFSNIKPKTLNNKVLNGGMYSELIKSYVGAINNGAVPNIENTWSLICKTECYKLMQTALETYDTLLKDVLNNKLPLPVEELKNYHIIGKQRAIGLFKRKAIGDNLDDYLKDLTKEIKLKYFNLKLENEREFNRVSNAFIVKEYCAVEKKLKNNEYKSFAEFEKDVKYFHAFFLENGPNGPNKRVVITEFLQKALVEGANYFLKMNNNESELQKNLYKDAKQKLEQELSEMKNDASKEKQQYFDRISKLEYEKSELELKEKNLKSSLNQWKELKENEELELKNALQSEKTTAQRSVEEYKAKYQKAEEALKEMERKVYLNNSEHDKQLALLKQRLEYFEKASDQSSNKEKELMNEMKNLKKDHLAQLKESSTKYDDLNKDFRAKFDQQLQKILDLENDLVNKEQKFDNERKKWKETEFNLQKSLEEAKTLAQKFQKEFNEKGNVSSAKYEEYRELTEKKLQTFTEKVNSLEATLKDKDELLKTLQSAYEKEKSMLSQKIEFLTEQTTETKNQYNEMKKAYDATLECFETNNAASSKEESNKIKELKELQEAEIKKLQLESENTKKQLTQQSKLLAEKNNELELQLKLKACEFTQEVEGLKHRIEALEGEKQQLQKRLKMLDENKVKIISEVDEQYSLRIKALEEDLEAQRLGSQRQLRESQEKFEENLAQIKTFYEAERERLERRIIEEKDKTEKKVSNIVEELESKIKEEQSSHEEEVDNLKQEIQELGLKNSSLVQQYEIELTLKMQNIESLEEYLKEIKENYAGLQNSSASSLENQLNNFTSERNQLLAKIEGLNLDIAKKNQEILALSQAKSYLESKSVRKEAILETSAKELTEGKQLLTQNLEEMRIKYQELSNSFMEKKAEFNKELALTKQQNEFLQAKTQELQKQINDVATLHEEKLKMQKEELGQKFKEEVERWSLEKTLLMTELDKLKKISSTSDVNHKEQIMALEKDAVILQEKYNSLEESTKAQIKKLTRENQTLLDQLSQYKEKHGFEKSTINEELSKYKAQYQEVEHKYNELMISFEKEQLLWKGKFQFLELQKEEAKTNLADTQKKLELTLQQIQKKRNMEVQEAEQQSNSKIATVEKKFQSQIEENRANHEKEIIEFQEKIKKLEREIKSLNEKNTIDSRSTQGSQLYIEKKLIEMEENEKRLQAELESTKADRDAKMIEHQKALDKERSTLKAKIMDYEIKLRELENKKNMQTFELEKEKAKWQLEKDHLVAHNNELQDILNTLEKKKDGLLLENEKLKTETKASKKSMILTGSNLNNFLYSKGNFTAVKVKPTSPRGSRDSPSSIDKNLSDITNKKKSFNGTGLVSRRTGSTCDEDLQF